MLTPATEKQFTAILRLTQNKDMARNTAPAMAMQK